MRNGNCFAIVTVESGDDVAACIEPINRFADRIGASLNSLSTTCAFALRVVLRRSERNAEPNRSGRVTAA
jgi:hypothetical protein